MPYQEVPSDQDVFNALVRLGGSATASMLCDELVKSHPRRESQLAIQRASERGRINVDRNWTFTLPAELVAA